MLQQHYQGNEWLHLPLITLIFFFLFFLGVVARVLFGMRNRRSVERLAALPFTDEPCAEARKESDHG